MGTMGVMNGGIVTWRLTAWDEDAGTPAGVLGLLGWMSGGVATQPPATSWEASSFLKPVVQQGSALHPIRLRLRGCAPQSRSERDSVLHPISKPRNIQNEVWSFTQKPLIANG